MDLDPKYNASCAGADGGEREYMSAACVGRNIGDSLDFGVTTMLYDGLLKNDSDAETSILHAMFPLTARRLGEGLMVGRERVITKKNGTARWDTERAEWDFTVAGSSYDNYNPLLRRLSNNGLVAAAAAVAAKTAVVRTFGRTGLLNSSRTIELTSSQWTVPVTGLNPGEVVIVSFKSDDDIATVKQRLLASNLSITGSEDSDACTNVSDATAVAKVLRPDSYFLDVNYTDRTRTGA